MTNYQIDKLLKNLTIYVDTREKKNAHITRYFEARNINYESLKLEHGDYSAYLPPCELLPDGLDLRDLISIERKSGLNELAGNFTKGRERFERELIRAGNARFILMIETSSYQKMVKGSYRSLLPPRSYQATMNAFRFRYNMEVTYLTEKMTAGNYIYFSLYDYARHYLKSI